MKAAEITDRLIEELGSGAYRHARVNYANGDMVGHTGHHAASIQAVAAVDLQIGRLLPVIEALSGALIVTADHGNADCMFEIDKKTGEPGRDAKGNFRMKTSHTLNPVPLHIFAPGTDIALARPVAARAQGEQRQPGLSNLAATVLHLMGFEAPEGFDPSLLDEGS